MLENYPYINDFSTAVDLRLYIIEHALHIEELSSKTIGYILGIDWKSSKSFGHGSVALSFNQKIQIIQDLKGLDKTDIQKFSDFMVIRNKFAHVKSINTFQDFFNSGKSATDIRKNLSKYYEIQNPDLDEETKSKIYFHRLFSDLIIILTQKIAKHEYERGRKAFASEYLLSILNEVGNVENGDEILLKAFKETQDKLF